MTDPSLGSSRRSRIVRMVKPYSDECAKNIEPMILNPPIEIERNFLTRPLL
jgi:hypothetical protein